MQVIKKILVFCTIFSLAYGSYLYLMQQKMIFPAPKPRAIYQAELPERIQVLSYENNSGKQLAYLRKPIVPQEEQELWVVFSGNASLALDWLWFLASAPKQNAYYLLIEYPGYGNSAGVANPESIAETSRGALRALEEHLGRPFIEPVNILGYSIGAAAALEFAQTIKVKKLVLLSPFTSLEEMAKRAVFWPFTLLLRYHYDNRLMLKSLLQQEVAPQITIISAQHDGIIPIEMGRELASISRDKIKYIEIPNAGHNNLLARGAGIIYREMEGQEVRGEEKVQVQEEEEEEEEEQEQDKE